MQFDEKLKQLRAQKGISQADLAEKIFVSRSAVAKWENGLGIPSEQSLDMLADFFEVSTSELMSDPTVETVMVTKNSIIGRQKTYIISITVTALTLIIGLAVLCGYFVFGRTNRYANPIISYRLIFETEKEIDTEKFVNYPDGEISADGVFADSRTFEMKHNVGAICLPELLVRKTVNGAVSYEKVDYSNLVFTCSDNILLTAEDSPTQSSRLSVLPVEYYAVEFGDWANIKYGSLFISIKVFRNRVAVEKSTVGFSDDSSEIQLAQSKQLVNDIEPVDANYVNSVYTIERIVNPIGEEYSGDLSEYAFIDRDYLTTTDKIEIGSVIYLFAVTEYDNIKSNVFAVKVVRKSVERISLTFPDFATDVIIGESKPLTLTCYPSNASFNVLNEQATVTLLTPEQAELEKTDSGWLLTVSSDAKYVGEKIHVKVETPEGVERTFYWTITGISIEKLTLLNADKGQELEQLTYINRNETLRLIVSVTPADATYEKISYNLFADISNFGRYVKLSEDGVLTVSDDAPSGMEIFISASAGRFSSPSYKIVVKD